MELPAPTAWPIVLAFGITLVFAGLVTTASVSVLGAILAVCGYIGWFRDVLPHEKMESVPVADIPQRVSTSRPQVTVSSSGIATCIGRDCHSRSIRSRRE